MQLYDQHLHSKHSMDSDADPEENVRAALDAGLAGLTFTEHFDTHPTERDACVYNDETYTRTIHDLRRKFGDAIFIGKGIEVCFQPDNLDEIVNFLDHHTLDLVLVSVHWCHGYPIHIREVWDDRDPSDVTRWYLEGVLQAMQTCERLHRHRSRVFDVLAHMDFCKRYSKRFADRICVEEHTDLIEKIFTCCLEADIVPEINTSTIRQGIGQSMPGPNLVKQYAALGGEAMSLGSDAHRSEDIAADFDTEVANLQSASIPQEAVYQQREKQLIPLG